jgi:hypothetical protein
MTGMGEAWLAGPTAACGRKQTGGLRLDTGYRGHHAGASAAPERSGQE